MQSSRFIAAAMTVLAPFAAFGEDAPTSKWKSDAELGLVITKGNTETQNVNAKLNVLNERAQWRHEGHIEALQTSSGDETTAEKYLASYKVDYKFTDVDYAFGMFKYENDRFSGYDYQTSETVGYGRRVVKTEAVTLDLELGAGARQTEPKAGDRTDESIVRGALNLGWAVSPTAVFTEQLTVEAGEEATITTSVTALKAKINTSLAMSLSYTVKNTSDVPPGIEETDTQTAVTLVYTLL